MRLSYEPGHLDLADLEDTWLAQLEAWMAEARERKVLEPNAMVVRPPPPTHSPRPARFC